MVHADPQLRGALRLLQQHAAGPVTDEFVNEIVLHLQGTAPGTIESELARIGGLLLEAVREARPSASETLACGLVYSTMDLIRTRLATIGRAGTA